MELGSVFLIFTVILLVGIYISRPFFDPPPRRAQQSSENLEHERSGLLAEYDRVLNALQELDFDHALGKIADEDYPSQRAFLLQNGAAVLKKLDEFQNQPGEAAAENHPTAEDRLEAAIAARRADSPVRSGAMAVPAGAGGNGVTASLGSTAANDDLEALIAIRRGARQEKAGGFCPRCGKPVQKSDHFCPKCGATLKAA